MKKLILFLLLPLWAMAQTSNGGETEFDYGIKNNSTQTITTPPYLGTFGTDGTQGKIPSAYIEKTDNKQNSLAVDGTGTKYPTVDAVNALKWIKSNESLSLAQRKGDVLYGILDQYTGEEITLSKVTGTPTVDGVVYFQSGAEYFKRDFKNLNPKWFGAKGDGVTDDYLAIQASVNAATYGGVIEFREGVYICSSPILISDAKWLIGTSDFQSGSAVIKSTGLYALKTPSAAFNSFSIRHISFIGDKTNSFIDQSLGGSYAWSSFENNYILFFKNVDFLTTGVNFVRNNFQNIGRLQLRGADYTVDKNFIGGDVSDTSSLGTDGLVEILSSTGVSFSGNYITSMRSDPLTNSAPVPLIVYNSSDIRVIDNWLDGGKNHCLSVIAGSDKIVLTSNRLANTESQSESPVKISNSRNVLYADNIITGLEPSRAFLQTESTIKNLTIRDNINNSFSDTTEHDVINDSDLSRTIYVRQNDLKVKSIPPFTEIGSHLFGRTLINTGAAGIRFWYFDSSKMLKGDYFYIKRVDMSNRVILTDLGLSSTTVYDSDINSDIDVKVVSYVSGEATVETNNLNGLHYGATANRPTVSKIGYNYFDTDLQNEIYWNGTSWKNILDNTVLTGTPTAPTAAVGTNTTQIATMEALQAAVTSNIAQTITNGVTTSAPSQDAVFDALALKANLSGANFTGQVEVLGASFSTNSNYRILGTGTGLVSPNNGNINFVTNHPSTPGWTANTNIKATFYKTTVYTVATLPTTGVESGTYATVSDATAPTYLGTLTGGGSVVCPVFYNGIAWVSH